MPCNSGREDFFFPSKIKRVGIPITCVKMYSLNPAILFLTEMFPCGIVEKTPKYRNP